MCVWVFIGGIRRGERGSFNGSFETANLQWGQEMYLDVILSRIRSQERFYDVKNTLIELHFQDLTKKFRCN